MINLGILILVAFIWDIKSENPATFMNSPLDDTTLKQEELHMYTELSNSNECTQQVQLTVEGVNMSKQIQRKLISKTQTTDKTSHNHVAKTLSNLQSEGSPYKIPIYFEDIIYRPEKKPSQNEVNTKDSIINQLTTTTAQVPVTGTGTLRKPFLWQPTQPSKRTKPFISTTVKPIMYKQSTMKQNKSRQTIQQWRQWKMKNRNRRITDDDDLNFSIENDDTNMPLFNWYTPSPRQRFRKKFWRQRKICGCMLYCESDFQYDGPCMSHTFPFDGQIMFRCCLQSFIPVYSRNTWQSQYYTFDD